jgi:hypothetical protein
MPRLPLILAIIAALLIAGGPLIAAGLQPEAVVLAIIAALLIAGGRLGKRWPVAIAGFVLLALAAVLVLLGWGTA